MTLPYRPNVGILLRNDEGHLFMGDRIRSEGPAWQFPQGGLDGIPGIVDAAKREIFEEIGVSEDLLSIIQLWPGRVRYDLPDHFLKNPRFAGRYRGQEQTWVLFDFLGTDEDIRIDTNEPEFRAWSWVAPGQALDMAADFRKTPYAYAMQRLLGPKSWMQLVMSSASLGPQFPLTYEAIEDHPYMADADFPYAAVRIGSTALVSATGTVSCTFGSDPTQSPAAIEMQEDVNKWRMASKRVLDFLDS